MAGSVSPSEARPRSPTAAFGLSLVPGSLIHGIGHRYAGRHRTAGRLFLAEIFGLALMSMDHPTGDITKRISDQEGSTQSGGDLQSLGRVLFFGSWLYDISASPDAVRRINRRRAQEGLELGFQPVQEGRRLSFNPRASYSVVF
jgi:hypothetical protein